MDIATKTVHAEVKLKQGGQLHCIAPSSSGRWRLTKIICEVYKCTFGGVTSGSTICTSSRCSSTSTSTGRSVVCSQLKWIGCLGSEERGTQAAVFLNLSRTRDKNKYVMYEKYLKNLVL